jgi:WD40 repeat protein
MLKHHLRTGASRVNCVAISPDSSLIVFGCSDENIYVWSADTGSLRHTLQDHHAISKGIHSGVHTLDLSMDGSLMVSASEFHVYVWNVRGMQNFQQKPRVQRRLDIHHYHLHYIISIKFAPDCKKIASSVNNGFIVLWSVETGEPLKIFTEFSGFRFCSGVTFWVAWSSDSRLIASSGTSGRVHLWDVDTGAEMMEPLSCPGSWPHAIDSKAALIVTSEKHHAIMIWDVKMGGEGHVRHRMKGHTACVNSISLSCDDRFIVSGSMDNSVRMWDVALGVQIRVLKGNSGYVKSVAWSPDGQYVVSGGQGGPVCVWSADAQVCACLLCVYAHTYMLVYMHT